MTSAPLYALVAEFEDPTHLLEATRRVHDKGFRKIDAYTPYQVKELDELLEEKRSLPLIVLIGGILGFLTAWGMEYYIAVIDYPTNIGGRPLNSWPSFIVIMFELTVLFASIFAFFGMLGLCGLPLPHHQMFNLRRFASASNDHFFLTVEARDPLFDESAVLNLLEEFEPVQIWELEDD